MPLKIHSYYGLDNFPEIQNTFSDINGTLEKQLPFKDDFYIHIKPNNILDDSENVTDNPLTKLTLTYNHPDFGTQQIQKQDVAVDDLKTQCLAIAETLSEQLNCPQQHAMTERVYSGDRPFPDGRGICMDCGVKIPNAFEALDNGTKIISGYTPDNDYVTQYDWGDTFVQKGEQGIVISKHSNNYLTAFFEAFPAIHGESTFIRGEGETVEDAEQQCWAKYQKQMQCVEHEFTRWVNNSYRTDGFARCIHCGFSSSKALPPETLCCECSTPTKKKLNENYYCLYHFYEQPFSEHVKDELAQREKFKFMFITDNESEITMDNYIDYCLKKWYLNDFGADSFENHDRALDHITRHIPKLIKRWTFQIKSEFSFDDDDKQDITFLSPDNEFLNDLLKNIYSELPDAINDLENKQSVSSDRFFVDHMICYQ